MATPSKTIFLRIDSTQIVSAERILKNYGITGEKVMTDIAKASRKPSKALQTLNRSAGGAQERLRDMAGTLAVIQGPLGPVAGRFTALSAVLGRVGIVGALAVGSTAALTAGLTASVRAAAMAEQQLLGLENALIATDRASGQTVEGIDEFAQSLGRATLTSRGEVRLASRALLSFRKVAGNTFPRVLTLAQDLSATFGGDLRANTIRLARALEDPARGILQLRRVGLVLAPAIRDNIIELSELGETAQATELLLAELEKRVGGAGAAEAGGLIGAFDTLGESIGDLLEQLGGTETLSGFLGGLTKGVDQVTDSLERNEQIRARLRLNQGGGLERGDIPITPGDIAARILRSQFQRFAAPSEREEALFDLVKRNERLRAARRADAAAIAADARDAGEALLNIENQLTEKLVKATRTRAEKIIAERDKLIARINVQRRPGTAARADAAIAQANQVAEAQLAKLPQQIDQNERFLDQLRSQIDLVGQSAQQIFIETKLRGLNAKATEEQTRAARSLLAQLFQEQAGLRDKKVAETLVQEIELTRLSARERAAATAVRRLSATATEIEKNQVRELAQELFDEAKAREAAKEAAKLEEQDRKLGENLVFELQLLKLTARERAIATSLRGLSATATEVEKNQVRELAGALFDEGRAQDAAAEARRKREADQKSIQDLTFELNVIRLSARERSVATAIRRLSSEATEVERAQVRELAGALFDEAVAQRAAKEAKRQRESDRKLIADLGVELELIKLTARERSIATALRRLSAQATEIEKDQVRSLAGALFDEAEAQKAAQKALQDTQRILDGLKTPLDRYVEGVQEARRLNELFAQSNGKVGLSLEQLQARTAQLREEYNATRPEVVAFQNAGRETVSVLADLARQTETVLGAVERLLEVLAEQLFLEPLREGVASGISGLFGAPAVPPGTKTQVPVGEAAKITEFTGALSAATSEVNTGLGTRLPESIAATGAATLTQTAASQSTTAALASLTSAALSAAAALQAIQFSGAVGGLGGGLGGGGFLNPFTQASSVFPGGGIINTTLGSFARGGRPGVGRVSFVGESGPEPFIADRPGQILSNRSARRALSEGVRRDKDSAGAKQVALNINAPMIETVVLGGGGFDDGLTLEQNLEPLQAQLVSMFSRLGSA